MSCTVSEVPELPDPGAGLRECVMPGVLPVLPLVELSGAYRGGSVPARSGGDWFDAFVTDAGLVAGVCGDVVGHGRAADAAMAELSTVLRVALLDGAGLAAAAAALDRHAARRAATRGATAVALLLDPVSGALEHVRLGHPPLLVREASGAVDVLDGPGGAPLGVGGPAPAVQRGVLQVGDAVLAFTDGLLGPASRTLDDGLAHLGRAAAVAGVGAAALCTAVTSGPAPDQDAAALAIARRPAPVAPLHLDVPADPGLLAGVRERLSDWLADLDVTAEGLTAVPLAASELVSNAVEHAYPAGGDPGRVRVGAELDGRGGVRITVADDGRWRPRSSRAVRRGGFGLAVVRDLSLALSVTTGPGGTTATAVCALHHRAPVAAPRPRPAAAPDPPEILERTGVPPVVSVRGVLDAAGVDPLHAAVLRASAGGSGPVRLDLGDVTLLTSAGIRVLHEITHLPGRPELSVPPDGPVARMLAIGGLDARDGPGHR